MLDKRVFMLAMSEMLVDARINTHEGKGMKWYKTLTLNQKINIKEAFVLLCGVDFQMLNFLFTLRERIELLYVKLIKEEIIGE